MRYLPTIDITQDVLDNTHIPLQRGQWVSVRYDSGPPVRGQYIGFRNGVYHILWQEDGTPLAKRNAMLRVRTTVYKGMGRALRRAA